MTLTTLIGQSRKYHNSHLDGIHVNLTFALSFVFCMKCMCTQCKLFYVKLMHCACKSCKTEKRYCRSRVNMKQHPNEKLKNTCIMVFSAFADFIDCCKSYYSKQPQEEESYENQPQSTTQEYNKHQRSIIENQVINHKNQAKNEDNNERTKERKDCENHNKPASEPRNHNKHNNGCLSVLRERVLVCPCFLVWVFFLFCIFCIALL